MTSVSCGNWGRPEFAIFEKVFIWQGDFQILIAIIKFIEDQMNLEADTNLIGVQSIILVEDNVNFYSSYLPLIYTEVLKHHQSLISEGVNMAHKLLRMRARPKILLCSTYEEAWSYYEEYQDCILGVISDIEFPNKGEKDPEAGIRLAREIRKTHFDVPILLQSDFRRVPSGGGRHGRFVCREGIARIAAQGTGLHEAVRSASVILSFTCRMVAR